MFVLYGPSLHKLPVGDDGDEYNNYIKAVVMKIASNLLLHGYIQIRRNAGDFHLSCSHYIAAIMNMYITVLLGHRIGAKTIASNMLTSFSNLNSSLTSSSEVHLKYFNEYKSFIMQFQSNYSKIKNLHIPDSQCFLPFIR